MTEFALQGLDSVLAKLRNMPENLQKSGAKRAVRAGAVVVQKSAISNALRIDDPTTSESIAKNIAVQYSSPKSKAEHGVVYRVGVLGGARKYANTRGNRGKKRVGDTYVVGGTIAGSSNNPGGDTYYWRFVEFGFNHKGGGHVEARPFMRPALENNINQATDAIVAALGPALDKAAAKGK